MLKNLNEIMTLIVSVILFLISLKILFSCFLISDKNNNIDNFATRINLMKNYSDNEED